MVQRILRFVLKRTTSSVSYVFSKAFSSKYLLFTNITVSAGLSGGADTMVQAICRRNEYKQQGKLGNLTFRDTIDKVRIMKISFSGLVMGALGHYWYLFLDKRIIGNTLRIVLKKTLIDQLVFAPIGIGSFFFILGYLDNNTTSQIISEVKVKGPEVMLVDWLVYPPAQFINFKFLPTRFRILYDCCVAFALDLYYSHIKYER